MNKEAPHEGTRHHGCAADLTPGPGATPSPSRPHVYQGTVQAVAAEDRLIRSRRRVGYALRVVHMRTLPVTQFARGGARLSLADLKPGDVVRAECRMTATGLVADRVEKVESSDSKQELAQ